MYCLATCGLLPGLLALLRPGRLALGHIGRRFGTLFLATLPLFPSRLERERLFGFLLRTVGEVAFYAIDFWIAFRLRRDGLLGSLGFSRLHVERLPFSPARPVRPMRWM